MLLLLLLTQRPTVAWRGQGRNASHQDLETPENNYPLNWCPKKEYEEVVLDTI